MENELTWEVVRRMIEIRLALGLACKEAWMFKNSRWAKESLGNWVDYHAGYLLYANYFVSWDVVEGKFDMDAQQLNKVYKKEMEALCTKI